MNPKHVMDMFNSFYRKIYNESLHLSADNGSIDRFRDTISVIKLEVLKNFSDSFADDPQMQALINEELAQYAK